MVEGEASQSEEITMMETYVQMSGYVGGPVDHRILASGSNRASFRIASTPRRRLENGGWQDGPTTWLTVVCFRQLATHVTSSLQRGDAVVVAGRLRTDRWVDQQGTQHERLVLQADVVGHDLNRGTSVFHKAPRRDLESADDEQATQTLASRAG